jgi:polysaccharide biosynthesis transport protein
VTTTGAPKDPASASNLTGRDLMAGEPSVYGPGRSSLADPSAASALLQSSPLAAQNEEGSGGGSGGILRTLKRRQGVFLFTFALVTGALAINTLRQRIFSPVYQGGFMLQIRNPFEARGGGGGGGTVESIARSTVQNDVPSLIVLMSSPLLVRPVALKYGVSIPEIASNLSITPAGEVQEVLNVNLRWRDPAKGRAILTGLAQEYTKFSLTQRQAAVDSGVKFLDEQAPDLLQRVERLQKELRTFRERNNFLDPGSMAGSIQGSRDCLGAVRSSAVEPQRCPFG